MDDAKKQQRLFALDHMRSIFAEFKNIVEDSSHPDHEKVNATVDQLIDMVLGDSSEGAEKESDDG